MAAEFAGFAAGEGCDDLVALAAGFVKPCGDGALAGTALRTGTARPPGQPERLSLRGFSTWVVVGSGFGGTGESAFAFGVVVCWFWE